MICTYQTISIHLGKTSKKKSKKRDIVTIDPTTYPIPPNSDIKFSDIFF